MPACGKGGLTSVDDVDSPHVAHRDNGAFLSSRGSPAKNLSSVRTVEVA